MAIPAQRFNILDRETKVGSANFATLLDSGIRNIADNAVKAIPASLSNLINNASETVVSLSSDFSNIFKEVERKAVSGIGSIIDFGQLDKKELADFTSMIAGGKSDIGKSLQDLFTKCTRSGTGLGYGGRPYRPTLGCYNGKMSVGYGGGYSNCNAANFTDLLNKLTDGAIPSKLLDKLKALTALLSLANQGYSLGMCGVFGSLVNSQTFSKLGLDKTDYSKAAGVLLSTLGTAQNTLGWIDTAATSITHDLTPSHFSPDIISDFLTNFKTPDQAAERDLNQIALSSIEAVSGLSPNWQKNELGQLSIGPYNGITDDAKSVLGVVVNQRTYRDNQLNIIPDTDDDFVLGALLSV